MKNRLIFRVYQLCLHTQAYVPGKGTYLKPLFLNAEEVMPFKRSIDPQHNPIQNCTKDPDQNFNFAIAQLPWYRAISRTIPDHAHIN
ncbi:hypothetical protein QUB70_24000 [Microcoleus sp. A003_D6]|uniref:hypothetical protein n=1 Tax=Microcoleus sp. A003_D6 TaxID=3055266 RepID=UPI002FD059D9